MTETSFFQANPAFAVAEAVEVEEAAVEEVEEVIEAEVESEYQDMTVAELKDELRDKDLPVSGNKDVLIDRLEEDDEDAVDPEPEAEPPAE